MIGKRSVALPALICLVMVSCGPRTAVPPEPRLALAVFVDKEAGHDTSPPLWELCRGRVSGGTTVTVEEGPAVDAPPNPDLRQTSAQTPVPTSSVPPGSAAIEQTEVGARPAARIVESFDALVAGFEGPQGTARFNNPSDNSLAVGPDHIVQIVNTRMAMFTKKGKKYPTTGKVVLGPVPTNTVFKGFGGAAEANNSGDAVVRYDQLANRWLIVMPIFRRGADRPGMPPPPKSGDPAQVTVPAHPNQPGPPASIEPPKPGATPAPTQRPPTSRTGPYSMCYAVSVGPDPLGPYYRYEFLRPLFPDYPRPAIWRDGYYVPTSTGDTVIQKQACVVDRDKMLKGEPATEQCIIIDGVNFLNNADIDGKNLPPVGAPNIMMAAGGMQLKKQFEDNAILVWRFHVDWKDPSKTKLTGPERIPVAPYHYLGDGQLSNCVPQPGTTRRLDSQGDKLMARLVYRRVGGHESIVAVHSINTAAGGGGVRWYEFRLDRKRDVKLYQQGTYAPDGFYRWLGSPAMDRDGNICIGYSFGGAPNYPGQRFAGRLASDPPGKLTLREAVLADGQGSQAQMRWEDYAQTAMDPSDDRTIWFVGDYIKKGNTTYTSRIGAFRLK